MVRVILDVGQSIDDFFTVALAACSPELHLIGITTVQDKDGITAGLMREVLRAYGRSDIPVVPGRGQPHEPEFITRALLEIPLTLVEKEEIGAVEFLDRQLAHWQDVTILATGPLTNVAALLHTSPRRAVNIREILFMGGWVTQALPDYNVRLDPEAAAEVLTHDVRLTTVGYEVTRGLRFLPEHYTILQSSDLAGAGILAALARLWCDMHMTETLPVPDPIVIAYKCGRLPAQLETIRVGIETEKGPRRGTVYQRDQNGRQIRMFTRVDTSHYMEFLLERVAPQRKMSKEQFEPVHWRLELNTAYQLDHYAGWKLMNATHSSHMIGLVLAGKGTAVVQGKKHELTPHTALYVPPNTPRSLHTTSGMSVLWFYFDVFIRENDAPLKQLPWPTVFRTASDTSVLADAGKRLVNYWQYARPEGPLLCRAALVELVTHLHVLTQGPVGKVGTRGEYAVQQAKRWIETRVGETFTLDDIARDVNLDKFHLLRLFKQAFKMTPLQYQRTLRMHRAKRLLKYSGLTISEIATGIGYASVTAFSRAFRRQYGVPPSAVRDKGQSRKHLV